MSGSLWDEKTETTFYYSSFTRIQGRMLRGTIAYLEDLEANKQLTHDILVAAGVPLPDFVPPSGFDAHFRPIIVDALQVLRSWRRQPTDTDGSMFSRMFGGSQRLEGRSVVQESQYPITEMLNAPFFIEKVSNMILRFFRRVDLVKVSSLDGVCPSELVQLGLVPAFVALEATEDRMGINNEGSKAMVDTLDRIERFTDWERCGGGDVEDSDDEDEAEEEKEEKPQLTTAQALRAVFAACAGDPESSVVAA
uniref:Uncharacterized protein n=1 Tax=Mycena chlorophos TaxID=658473 RepID=A0ABQ0KVK0_MYCCL|nr:predicted protein [Mycena chlorophos]